MQVPRLLFQDEFDGPPGSPTPANWSMQNWADDVTPPVAGLYATIGRNVFLDATPISSSSPHERVISTSAAKCEALEGTHRYTWEARIKLDCLTPGAWPSFWR